MERGRELAGRDDDNGPDASGECGLDGAGDEGAPADRSVEFVRGTAEAAAGAGGEDDSDDGLHAASLAATGGAGDTVEPPRHDGEVTGT